MKNPGGRRWSCGGILDGKHSNSSMILKSSYPLLQDLCRLRAVISGTLLDQHMQSMERRREKMIATQFVAPFTWSIGRVWFQLSCLAVFLFMLYSAITATLGFRLYGVSSCKNYRIDLLSHSETPVVQGGNFLLQLRRSGCDVWSTNFTLPASSVSASVDLIASVHAIPIDGFAVAMPDDWNETVPVRFVLKGSNDDGISWNVVGSSEFRLVPEGVRFLNTVRILPSAKVLTFETWPRWPFVLNTAVNYLILAFASLGTALTGIFNRPSVGRRWFVFGCSCQVLNLFAAGVGYCLLDMAQDCFYPFGLSLAYATITAVLIFAETYFPDCLSVVGIFGLVGSAIQHCAIFEDCDYLSESPPYTPMAITFAGVVFVLLRLRFGTNALRAVLIAQANYDAEWNSLLADPNGPELIERLRVLSDRVSADCTTVHARHLNRMKVHMEKRTSGGSLASGWNRISKTFAADFGEDGSEMKNGIAGSKDEQNPVMSLDQLYSQATGVAPAFHSKCKSWADRSMGYFDHAASRDSVQGWVERRFIKRPERAIEKALCCYQSDVSRLLDICRGRIVFDSVADILACVELIVRPDSDAEVVRIKNSLHPQHDSRLSGGFRVVVLNLCICTEQTKMLGLENHVCELQLLLKGFDSVLTGDRHLDYHARYLDFRAVRRFYSWQLAWRRAPTGSSVYPEPASLRIDYASPSAATKEVEGGAECVSNAGEVVVMPPKEGDATLEVDAGASAAEAGWMELAPANSDAEMFLNVFLRSTLRPGGFLASQGFSFREAFLDSSVGSVWFSSTPLAAATTKRVFQIFLLMLALYFGYLFGTTLFVLKSNSIFLAKIVCLSVSGLRNSNPVDTVNLASFGLLLNGCKVPHNASQQAVQNSTICVSFDEQVRANGYFIITGSGPVQLDPVRWIVRSTLDGGTTWQVVGASEWRLFTDGVRVFPQLSFSTPETRGTQVNFDHRPSWPWLTDWTLDYFISCIGYFCCSLAGFLGRSHIVKTIWLTFYSMAGVCFALAAVGYHLEGRPRAAIACWLAVLPQVVFLISLAFYEVRIIRVLLLCSITFAICLVSANAFLFDSGWGSAFGSVLQSASALAFAFAVVVSLMRNRALRRALKLVVLDKEIYDRRWTEICSVDGVAGILIELRREVEHLSTTCRKDAPMQINRQFQVPDPSSVSVMIARTSSAQSVDPGFDWRECVLGMYSGRGRRRNKDYCGEMLFVDQWIPGTLDDGRPLDSLDQLFVQASSLHPILLRKVQQWALASNGCFQCTSRNTYVKYADVQHDPSASIRWAKIKSVSRAVEKVFRVYAQDASKLVDVCRQSIIFEDVGGVLACLKAMGRDEEVQIVRIKNRMDPDFDSARSAGYRDVAVNLRVVTPQTLDLGVETHVCEVQLLLQPIAELKNDDFHKRYVSFRNLRGE